MTLYIRCLSPNCIPSNGWSEVEHFVYNSKPFLFNFRCANIFTQYVVTFAQLQSGYNLLQPAILFLPLPQTLILYHVSVTLYPPFPLQSLNYPSKTWLLDRVEWFYPPPHNLRQLTSMYLGGTFPAGLRAGGAERGGVGDAHAQRPRRLASSKLRVLT